jgi:Zn-dependent peptidase ImmA (M78 family)
MTNLTQEEITKIDLVAHEVLLSTKTDDKGNPILPIDLSGVLKMYSIQIKEGIFKDANISGLYDRKSNSIYLSKTEPYERKAFTIAHELGHFLLHENNLGEIFYRSTMISLDETTQKDEAEANCFAASLLIPEEQLREYWELTHDFGKLAKIFGVSNSAIFFRAKNMSLVT